MQKLLLLLLLSVGLIGHSYALTKPIPHIKCDIGYVQYFLECNKIDEASELLTNKKWVGGEPEVYSTSTVFYMPGRKKLEGNYKDGKLDGTFTIWYKNGQKKAETNYKDGKADGKHTEWYENGQKEREGNHRKSKAEGKWTFWLENGQVESERIYKYGKLIK